MTAEPYTGLFVVVYPVTQRHWYSNSNLHLHIFGIFLTFLFGNIGMFLLFVCVLMSHVMYLHLSCSEPSIKQSQVKSGRIYLYSAKSEQKLSQGTLHIE